MEELCANGQCLDKMSLDQSSPLSITTETFSHVFPQHQQKVHCICQLGYGGTNNFFFFFSKASMRFVNYEKLYLFVPLQVLIASLSLTNARDNLVHRRKYACLVPTCLLRCWLIPSVVALRVSPTVTVTRVNAQREKEDYCAIKNSNLLAKEAIVI